jgi:hypothetical protein
VARAFDYMSLSWKDNSTNEQGFRIERQSPWDTNFHVCGTVASNVTSFSEYYLPGVFYRVQAIGLPDSAYSDVATAQSGILDPIPPSWQGADIGPVGLPGGEDFRNGQFIIGSSGSDVGGMADQFHFVYQALSGDGEIAAPYAGWAAGYFASHDGKSGLMIRQSLDPDSANIYLFTKAGGGGYGIQIRTNTGANTDTISIPNGASFDGVRVTRLKNVFSVYARDEYQHNWMLLASRYIAMKDPVYIGMAASSHTNIYLQISQFNDVRVAPLGGALEMTCQSDKTVRLTVSGMFGHTYGIDASSDLQNWVRITTQVSTNSVIEFTNNDAASYPRRFYRPVLVR